VLLNDGKAGFVFKPLPRLAQIAPANSVQITDYNADGLPDLLLTQNNYSPEPETGQMDGGVGLLLTGNGNGSFSVVLPAESGILAPADSKSLVQLELGGDYWPDFIFGINNLRMLSFESQRVGPHKPLLVRLSGSPGNPTAIGARVTIVFDEGPVQTAEVYAGGSYLSQSSSVLAFGRREGAVLDQSSVSWPDGNKSSYLQDLEKDLIDLRR